MNWEHNLNMAFTDLADKYRDELLALSTENQSPAHILDKLPDHDEREQLAELILSLHRDAVIPLGQKSRVDILSIFRNAERKMTILIQYHDLYPIDLVLEKLAPQIEHFPEMSREILKLRLITDTLKTTKFLADLAVVSYPFADELFEEMKNWYRLESGAHNKQNDRFDEMWQEVEAIRKDRILLFPEVMD